ncbi:MAG: cytochrome c biosis protein CcmG, thiol:disulfide interchange protein DsbE [Solirubrobacterales bacterium]|jgi:thiol-disulfide isomerase/thioredoxin|nr:cytochrome c biosis protein CcmG, thiol:disulfide interchange protein DsbE [Solirubrobacterales bacterium]
MPGVSVYIPPALSQAARKSCEPNVRIVIKELMKKGLQLAIGLILVAAGGLIAAGCGAGGGGDYGGEHPDYAALAGAPAPLAALYKEGNQLLPGGVPAFERRIAALKGFPVVVNVWASWCGPCRFEFPTLQKLSAAYGKRVAFLGVDSQDSDAAAKTFLAEAPVPYPSYTDPDQGITETIGATGGLPDTAFYDSGGSLCYLKQGPYTEHAELAADIQRFALHEECEGG